MSRSDEPLARVAVTPSEPSPSSKRSLDSPEENIRFPSSSKAPAAGDVRIPSPKKRRLERPGVSDSSADEGEIVSGSGSSSPATDDTPASHRYANERISWNRGIRGALRTSFGGVALKGKTPLSAATEDSRGSTAGPTDSEETKDGKNDGRYDGNRGQPSEGATPAAAPTVTRIEPIPQEQPVFKEQDREWLLPPLAGAKGNPMSAETWPARIRKWREAFTVLNKLDVDGGPGCAPITEAFVYWADLSRSLSRKQRSAAKAAAYQFADQDDPQPEGAGEPPSAPHAGDKKVVPDGSSLRQEPTERGLAESELAYQERYFPGVPADALFCVLCASSGHREDRCPNTVCRFCQATEHASWSCPTRRRCLKCKQLGHGSGDCQEKLALAPGEGVECAFCQSHDHTESNCAVFRRSFWPDEANVGKVQNLPIYCYCCGGEGHYGTECGLSSIRTGTGVLDTWSTANWDRYVDPQSTQAAIIWDPAFCAISNGRAADAGGRPDFGGKSIVPRTHIIFEDDDEEDEGFIHPPVQKPTAPGQIKVKTNGRGGLANGQRGRGGKNQRGSGGAAQMAPVANPPLPPGPPPPLPPPQSLPRRPPAPAARQQSQSRGKKQKTSGSNSKRGGRGQGDQETSRRKGSRPYRGGGKRGAAA